MKPILTAMVACALCAAPAAFADAADAPLIISLKSNIYGYQGPNNNFTIYLGSTEKDVEFYVEGPKTQEYIYVDPYTLGTDSDGNKGVVATAVPLSVSETDNEIRIYGDATKLDYIDVHGCYLGSIDLPGNFTNLSVIDLSHNELKAIDLSPFLALASIDLLDNAFTDPSAMKIGTNHPGLQILSVGINDVIDPELDLRNFPELQYFSARNNYALTHVDPSGCPDLVSLVLEVTNISSIDVSKNLNLDVLNISNTKITSVDLSKNTRLGEFYMSHAGSYNSSDEFKVESIDVSNNKELEYLDLSGNKLTSVDVTNNPRLLLLYLQNNLLSKIDLSKNTRLASINLSNNLFTFATLPLPQEGWDYAYYRSPFPCNFKYKVGEKIDFSSQVIRAPYVDAQGNTITPATYAMVFASPKAGDNYEVAENLYEYSDGVITFLQAIPDEVYVKFYCTAFPDWPMQSDNFMVKTPEDFDAPATAFTFTPSSSMAGKQISFRLGGAPLHQGLSLPADITISAGDETTTLIGAVSQSTLPTEANISFTLPATVAPVRVMITDGFGATALEMTDITMSNINLTTAENLESLTLTGARLPSIDLSYNRRLRTINLSNNILTSIDFSGVRGDYEKYYLTDINLSGNKLMGISATIYDVFENLNLADNAFAQFDFKYYTGLKTLDISNNRLKGDMDLSTVTGLENLNISGNNISGVNFANLGKIKALNVADNNFSFATLPVVTSTNTAYTYAPQNPYSILSAGAAVNLSDQNVSIDGSATSFVWKYASDGTVVPANLYTDDNGAMRFSEGLIGSIIFCEMTNPGFPDFNNSPLTTTNIEVMGKPTNLVASFTTAESGMAQVGFRFNSDASHAVYIDWNGDGSQYDEYLYDSSNTAIYRQGQSVAGKTVKVYTYTDPTEVTCIYTLDTKLTDFDATPMARAEAIALHNAGLKDGKIRIPENEVLYELALDGNNFSAQTFPNIPALRSLNLAGSSYKTFDASLYPNLQFLQISNNQIASIKFEGNNSLYQLDATSNLLSEINLSGLPSLGELILIDNNLKEIDLTSVKGRLRALQLEGNYFTFATLPSPSQFENIYYTYGNQKPLATECVDGKIDLSSQAYVGSTPTEFKWFLGDKQSDVYYDYYYEAFMGEELEGPEANPNDPEYRVTDGITYFYYTQPRKVIGALTNEAMPKLILFTTPTAIDRAAGVEDVSVDNESNMPVDVFTLTGVRIRTNVMPSKALEGLAPGMYIVGNRKIAVK